MHTEPRLAMSRILKYLAPDCTALDRSWQPWLVSPLSCSVAFWLQGTEAPPKRLLLADAYCIGVHFVKSWTQPLTTMKCKLLCNALVHALILLNQWQQVCFWWRSKCLGELLSHVQFGRVLCGVCRTCGLGRSSSWCLSLSLSFSSCSCCSLIWLLPPMTAGFWGLEGSWVPCFTGALWVIRCWFRAACKKT